ncbi:MAG: hypothetical protein ACKOGD_00425 [Sphingomonadales bacterium]
MRHEVELIKSSYHPQEALEVLGNLIQQKIAYHSKKTLRHKEMFGTPDLEAEGRLGELHLLKKRPHHPTSAIRPAYCLANK